MAEIKRDWKIGDKFRVRSKEQIKKELDSNNETHGIYFSKRMEGFYEMQLTAEDGNNQYSIIAVVQGFRYSFAYEWIEQIFQYPWSKYVSMG